MVTRYLVLEGHKMGYIISGWQLGIGIVGFISLIVLVVGLFFFGKLIWHKTKIAAMAKRGFTQVRHIREDMVENYYFIRIKDDHYDFDGGIYMEQKDVKTKTRSLLAKLDYRMLSRKTDEQFTAEEDQIRAFLKSLENYQVMDITTLSWGIPTITYYGNNPNPINPKDVHKVYDAKNIAAMIKRLLLTKEWKLVKMVLYLCAIAIVLWIVLGFLDYGLASSNAKNLAECINNWNSTQSKYEILLNTTKVVAQQSSTIVI
jgi:hypothetical protein